MSVSIDDASASSVILEYLSDRNKWERDARRLSRVKGDDSVVDAADAPIQAGYEGLLQKHCAPRVIALELRAHFRHPPLVDPDPRARSAGGRLEGEQNVVPCLDTG
jgi:hypothetical protein